ncbi:MAG: hypothetical protein NTY38_26695 [Acidobacteria bacterium]|nr:hypothetical protein [Acidobacteriota bacterium]
MYFVSRFLDNAASIFEAAEFSVEAGMTPSDMTILVGVEGGIRLVAGSSDWPLDTLQASRGAEMVYRVSRAGERVRVEGRAGSQTCVLETEARKQAAASILRDQPRYTLVNPTPTAYLLPAGI